MIKPKKQEKKNDSAKEQLLKLNKKLDVVTLTESANKKEVFKQTIDCSLL
jgi:hypothetical protein